MEYEKLSHSQRMFWALSVIDSGQNCEDQVAVSALMRHSFLEMKPYPPFKLTPEGRSILMEVDRLFVRSVAGSTPEQTN